MTGGGTVIGAIGPGDWAAVAALEAGAYDAAGLTEGRAALESRAAPGTSFVARAGGRVVGYVLALPFPRFRVPALAPVRPRGTAGPAGDRPVRADGQTPVRGTGLHLHDLVVGAGQRGRGLAGRLHAHLLAAAALEAYTRVSLVAVCGSAPFWTALGYRPHPHVPVPPSYGAVAVYMSRGVDPLAGHR